MKLNFPLFLCLIFCLQVVDLNAQSPSFETYVNPVIPGDHPDPTLTKVGAYFYTSGSSFNPTPKIYRSTDLVHWEVIAQPVSATWSQYGNTPGSGIWGGHTVFHHGKWWHYFGRGGGSMYFVTAEQPEGPWSSPTRVNVPSELSSLGVDNSIFIDNNGKWYMLAKHGRENNHILELGEDGQPTGAVLDLTWLNPDDRDNPYGWAEGPVMWKRNGWYYYSFAQHLAGSQYVMKSDTLTDRPSDWDVKSSPMQYGNRGNFNTPNHISPVVQLSDGTNWVIGHSYHRNWITQGRQGLLLEITYDEEGFPEFNYPQDAATDAPDLPSSGIPWMVPKSDMFDSDNLKPEWSFLGQTPDNYHSLTARPGWMKLDPGRRYTTVIQNDGEHFYSLLTRINFEPSAVYHEAGLWIFNGPQNLQVKLVSSVNDTGANIIRFSFDETEFEQPHELGSDIWLKLVRNEHEMLGYYSNDGGNWMQVGEAIDATELNVEQTDFNSFTGNQQGLYAQGEEAYFDLYVYRDAYSPIPAANPANYYGLTANDEGIDNIHSGDWAMYAGVEFGSASKPEYGFNYQRTPDSIFVEASVATNGGVVEVWLDSIETGQNIATCEFPPASRPMESHTCVKPVPAISGQHDVYLRFLGETDQELFWVTRFWFKPESIPLPTSAEVWRDETLPNQIKLHQNYPNPFNPITVISYQLPVNSEVLLKVFDMLGREVATLVNGKQAAGKHQVSFNASELSSGMYIYQLKASDIVQTRKMMLIK